MNSQYRHPSSLMCAMPAATPLRKDQPGNWTLLLTDLQYSAEPCSSPPERCCNP